MPRLARLYAQHAHELARIAYLLTGDEDLAHDLVQEAFARTAGRFADIRDEASLYPYLRATLVNLVRKHFRRRVVERRWLDGQPRREAADDPDQAARITVVAALHRLPERQRTALVLRHYADMSDASIADAMRCPVGTVKSLLSRGASALRTILGEQP